MGGRPGGGNLSAHRILGTSISDLVTPERSTSPHRPSSTTFATAALQLPSGDVGKPEKLRVHPGWELQNS